jgi:hypothetical protein
LQRPYSGILSLLPPAAIPDSAWFDTLPRRWRHFVHSLTVPGLAAEGLVGSFLASLLSLFGAAQPAPEGDVRMVDPQTIYFSISTIENELPAMEPLAEAPLPTDLVLHEDDWRQVEFFDESRLAEIQAMMKELAIFVAANREGDVFRNIYIRRLPPASVLPGPDAVRTLAGALGAEIGPGPFLRTSSSLSGQVAQGFNLALAGKAALYGLSGAAGIRVMGATYSNDGDRESLLRAFRTLNQRRGLILVDWRSQMILTGLSPDGEIEVWRPDGG